MPKLTGAQALTRAAFAAMVGMALMRAVLSLPHPVQLSYSDFKILVEGAGVRHQESVKSSEFEAVSFSPVWSAPLVPPTSSSVYSAEVVTMEVTRETSTALNLPGRLIPVIMVCTSPTRCDGSRRNTP